MENTNSHLWLSPVLFYATPLFQVFSIHVSLRPILYVFMTNQSSDMLKGPLLPSSATLVLKRDQTGLKLWLMTLESLSSIFLPIFTQFLTSKRHVSSNQYMCPSTTELSPNLIYTKASNLSRPVTAFASTHQERSGCMDTVQEHHKLVKPTCKTHMKQEITCETSICYFLWSSLG